MDTVRLFPCRRPRRPSRHHSVTSLSRNTEPRRRLPSKEIILKVHASIARSANTTKDTVGIKTEVKRIIRGEMGVATRVEDLVLQTRETTHLVPSPILL